MPALCRQKARASSGLDPIDDSLLRSLRKAGRIIRMPEQTNREEITLQVFERLVELAALELEPAEAKYLRRQLNNQLTAIHELEAIPLDESSPVTTHGVPYTPAIRPSTRADEWLPYPHPEDILGQAPEQVEGYIIVPEIPHTELE